MGVQEALSIYEWREAPAASFAVIGDPITHSKSPAMHNAAYRELGLNYTYVPIRVPSGEALQALDRLRSLGYQGVNVTLPLKQEVIGWLKECDEFAARVGAVNTIRLDDRYGFNTDAPGFMKTLDLLNIDSGCPTLVLGAGGAARAIVAALADEGYPLRIWNRTKERAEIMIESLEIDASVWDDPELLDAKLVINTTSAGHRGDRIPIDWSHGMSGLVAYDISYGHPSAFLIEAEAEDIRAVDGLGMLVMQGAYSFEWWLELDAPHDAMWDAAR